MKRHFAYSSIFHLCLAFLLLAGPALRAENWPELIRRNMPAGTPKPKFEHRILCNSNTWGYRHASIPTGNAMISIIGEMTGLYKVDFSSNVQDYSAENLKRYDALVFNNSTKLETGIKDPVLRKNIILFVRNGGGLVCMHAASSGGWPEYTEMIGGAFDGHPWTAEGRWHVANEDPQHPIVCDLYGGTGFEAHDELYQFKNFKRSNVRVLLSIDMSVASNHLASRKRLDDDYALVWIKRHGSGRIFQCALGHHDEFYANREYLEMWIKAFRYVLRELDVPEESKPKGRIKFK